jgi:drug/metabolite transporter (DMT)-like permease
MSESKGRPTGLASPRGAAAFVVLAGLAFSTSGPLSRYARPADPLFVAFGRLAVAAVVLLVLDARRIVPSVARLTGAQRAKVVLAGAILALHFALFLIGLDRTSLPAAVSLVSLEPLSVVLSAWALFKLKPSRAEQLGVVLATIGAVVVALGAGKGDHRLSGDLLVLGAVILYGLYLAVARALKDALPPLTYAALVYAVAALCIVPALPFFADVHLAALETHSIIAIVALGLIPTIGGHTAVQTASRVLSPSVVALVSPGETLGGILIGATMLGALPSGLELIGAALILAGSVVAIRLDRRKG